MSATALGLLALGAIFATGTIWFRSAMALRLPKNRAAFVGAMAAGVVLAVAALASGPGWIGGIAASLAMLLGGFFLFTVSISRQRLGGGGIAVGARLPDFSAPDEDGKLVELAGLSGKPLLVKFFRGHW